MRVWSLAPALLDRQGLVACWRETLLAQAVLAGKTRGYAHHPQLERFKAQPDPLACVGVYLEGLHDEATARSFTFNRALVLVPGSGAGPISVTVGQVRFEVEHLRAKLAKRSPELLASFEGAVRSLDWSDAGSLGVVTHPLFEVVPGGVEPWERV